MAMPLLVPWRSEVVSVFVSSFFACGSRPCPPLGFAAMWQHFRSDAVEVLLEKFTGFVRVPVEDTDSFQKWYDDLVEQQLLATAAGDRARAAFLSKKKTKVLRYALPQCFLEQFFHRHAARLAQDAVPDVRNSIAAADLRVAASILDFLDLQPAAAPFPDFVWALLRCCSSTVPTGHDSHAAAAAGKCAWNHLLRSCRACF